MNEFLKMNSNVSHCHLRCIVVFEALCYIKLIFYAKPCGMNAF